MVDVAQGATRLPSLVVACSRGSRVRLQINIRLLIITLVVLVVFGAAFHAVHVWQVDRNVASLLAYAREAKKNGKIDRSMSLYEQYLKLQPKDLDVYEEYALEFDAAAQSLQDHGQVARLLE